MTLYHINTICIQLGSYFLVKYGGAWFWLFTVDDAGLIFVGFVATSGSSQF